MSTTKVASLKQNWNAKTPSVKRILQEVKELTKQVEDLLKERGEAEASGSTSGGEGPATSSGKDASSDGVVVVAEALEENIFEWHFAIGGQVGSEFEGGIYHGRILLPPEYPFKPPDFMMLTASGRFEVGKRICLSISRHHPEHWQPSWSVRTALTALIAFMPTPGHGALGSLQYTEEEKKALAAKSRSKAPKFGAKERQEVTDRIHEKMIKLVPPSKRAAGEEEAKARSEATEPTATGTVGGDDGQGAAAAKEVGARPPQERLGPVRPPPRRGAGDTLLSMIFWILVALATCAILKNLAKELL